MTRFVLIAVLAGSVFAGCRPPEPETAAPSTDELLARAQELGLVTAKERLPNVGPRPEEDDNAAAIIAKMLDDKRLYKHLSRRELNDMPIQANGDAEHLAAATALLQKVEPELADIRKAAARPASWYGEDLKVQIAFTDSIAFMCASAIRYAREGRQDLARRDLEATMRLGEFMETNRGSATEIISRATAQTFVSRAAVRMAVEAKSQEDLASLRKLVAENEIKNSPADLVAMEGFEYYKAIGSFSGQEKEESLKAFLPMVIEILEKKDEGGLAMLDAAAAIDATDQNFSSGLLMYLEAWLETEAKRNAALAYIDLMAARLDSGAFPDALPQEIADPFSTGSPLRYRKTANGFRVWSVGSDRRDSEDDISYAYPVRDPDATRLSPPP